MLLLLFVVRMSATSAVIKLLEDFPLPVCEQWMHEGIRHLVRNCDNFCEHGDDCNTPGRYDGNRMAALLNAIPGLVNEIHRLK